MWTQAQSQNLILYHPLISGHMAHIFPQIWQQNIFSFKLVEATCGFVMCCHMEGN